MSFIQSIIKNALKIPTGVRNVAGQVAKSGAKTTGAILENGATFFKKIAERYEQANASPAPAKTDTPSTPEATPTPVDAETPNTPETLPTSTAVEATPPAEIVEKAAPQGELNENTLMVYRAIEEAFNQNGETPSQGKIADLTGFSKSTISRHVGLLELGGYIKRADDKTRKIILTDKKLEG